MKTKTDFITNSSSTSFIVGDLRNSKDNELKIELTIKYDLANLVREKITTLQELDDYFESDINDEYRKAKSVIEKGGTVYVLIADTDNYEGIETFLCENGLNNCQFPKDILLIRGTGGF